MKVTCKLCLFDVELDDVELLFPSGRCVCLRCYLKETGNLRPMAKAVRQQFEAVANAS